MVIECRWCLKPNRSASNWEQQHITTGEWLRLCTRCANKRLDNPWNALLGMRTITTPEVPSGQ